MATGQTITANGVHQYYEEHGSGIPLILLHGSFDCTCALWQNQVGPLSKK